MPAGRRQWSPGGESAITAFATVVFSNGYQVHVPIRYLSVKEGLTGADNPHHLPIRGDLQVYGTLYVEDPALEDS